MTVRSKLRGVADLVYTEVSAPLRRAWYVSPFNTPWRSPILELKNDAVGETLMLTPSLREIKRINPACRLHVFTKYPSLLRGLPYVDAVLPFEAAPRRAVDPFDRLPFPRRLRVTHIAGRRVVIKLPARFMPDAHLSRQIGTVLGVRVSDVRPDCVVGAGLVERWRREWRALPHPRILLSRKSSGWSPNKDWPDACWDGLIERLARVAGVIETGISRPTAPEVRRRNYVDLRGRTTIDELAAAVAAADLHVGPISGPVHLAAAAGTPSLIIYGGFERPSSTQYPGNIALYTPLSCAPCLLIEACPYDRRCLTAISPATVEAAIWQLWRQISGKEPVERAIAGTA